MTACPRVIISATSGDGGKTLVALSLLLALRSRGLRPSAFKKGPDYIDAAWLGWAAGQPAYNLDSYLMDRRTVLSSLLRRSQGCDVSVIEGNRGLYDGFDAQGTHSTAELAKLLKSPVVLVLNATKATRTVAAVLLGCQQMDPRVRIAGVILNRVAGSRHESVIRRAVEAVSDAPVVGVIPKQLDWDGLPDRHLGLVTPAEHGRLTELARQLTKLAENNLDLQAICDIADSAQSLAGDVSLHADAPLEVRPGEGCSGEPATTGDRSDHDAVTVGYLYDSAFTFYYPENIEALCRHGARVVPIGGLVDAALPPVDALYIGGGFPETHAGQLARNQSLLQSIRLAADSGLPIYAECGGLMLLAKALRFEGKRYPMAGVFPIEVEVEHRPQGHGYMVVEVDQHNAYFPQGQVLRGHEFHYSRIVGDTSGVQTAFAVKRGVGCFDKRDGLVYKNVLACYLHLHALGDDAWVRGLMHQAKQQAKLRAAEKNSESSAHCGDRPGEDSYSRCVC